MRLKKGDVAPHFQLPSIEDKDVSLQDFTGKKVLLILNRWANCPFCSLTLTKIVNRTAQFESLGIETVMVFPSTASKIKQSLPDLDIGKIQFLSDEVLDSYKRYGTEATLKGEIKTLTDIPTLMQALRKIRPASLLFDGKLNQLPASFLINPLGKIDATVYGETFTDIIDLDVVLDWGKA